MAHHPVREKVEDLALDVIAEAIRRAPTKAPRPRK
jgi:hypothetical protein